MWSAAIHRRFSGIWNPVSLLGQYAFKQPSEDTDQGPNRQEPSNRIVAPSPKPVRGYGRFVVNHEPGEGVRDSDRLSLLLHSVVTTIQ
jgi:hypothetical protein